MKKNIVLILFSLLTLLNSALIIINIKNSNPTTMQNDAISNVIQSIRGDISLNQGGITSQVTPQGDLWIYSSSDNKIFYITKPTTEKEIEIKTTPLVK